MASNSLILSISVPIAMLVTFSRITSTTTGTRYFCAIACASASAPLDLLRVGHAQAALQPRPCTTAWWSTP